MKTIEKQRSGNQTVAAAGGTEINLIPRRRARKKAGKRSVLPSGVSAEERLQIIADAAERVKRRHFEADEVLDDWSAAEDESERLSSGDFSIH